jgi:hypothetical protein
MVVDDVVVRREDGKGGGWSLKERKMRQAGVRTVSSQSE